MKVATVVEMEAKEVLDAIGDRARDSMPKVEHMGGREVVVRFGDDGKVVGATVTFNGTLTRKPSL